MKNRKRKPGDEVPDMLMLNTMRFMKAQEKICKVFLAYLKRTEGILNEQEEEAVLEAEAERTEAGNAIGLATSKELLRRTTGWPPDPT